MTCLFSGHSIVILDSSSTMHKITLVLIIPFIVVILVTIGVILHWSKRVTVCRIGTLAWCHYWCWMIPGFCLHRNNFLYFIFSTLWCREMSRCGRYRKGRLSRSGSFKRRNVIFRSCLLLLLVCLWSYTGLSSMLCTVLISLVLSETLHSEVLSN